jgi:uncharacterized repeat protein (TIGR02543 family)
MSWKQHRFSLAAFAVACLMGLAGCGHEQQLESITIQPTTETFGASNIPVIANAGATVQLRALGNYIHPPVTKDITAQVTWSSNTPDIATVNSGGLLTATGAACGDSLISATFNTNKSTGNISSSGAVITGSMTATVVCFTGSSGGSGPILTVNFAGSGSGAVTSSPPGVVCSSNPCTATFASGTTINLTAVASGVFAGWTNCDATSGTGLTICTVNGLAANRTVTATFN